MPAVKSPILPLPANFPNKKPSVPMLSSVEAGAGGFVRLCPLLLNTGVYHSIHSGSDILGFPKVDIHDLIGIREQILISSSVCISYLPTTIQQE